MGMGLTPNHTSRATPIDSGTIPILRYTATDIEKPRILMQYIYFYIIKKKNHNNWTVIEAKFDK